MKKLQHTVTMSQLQKLVNVLPDFLPDSEVFTSDKVKSFVRRGVYARVLADLVQLEQSLGQEQKTLYVPYNIEGITETDWDGHDLDQRRSPDIVIMLRKMNGFINTVKVWFIYDYVGEADVPYAESAADFDELVQDAHDWVIARLRKSQLIRDSDFNTNTGIPLIQEDGYSLFKNCEEITIVADKTEK